MGPYPGGASEIEGEGVAAETEMAGGAANGGGVCDRGDHVPASTASGATQDIFSEDTRAKLGPGNGPSLLEVSP